MRRALAAIFRPEEGRGATQEGAARPLSKGAGDAGCPLHPRPVCNGSKHTVVTTVENEVEGDIEEKTYRSNWFKHELSALYCTP